MNTPGLTGTDFHRRRDLRTNIILPVQYTIPESDPQLAHSVAIGGGGLQLILPMAVSTGAIIDLTIHLPGYRKIPCTARVVWTEPRTRLDSIDFKAGMAFQHITEHDLGTLRTFIQEQQNPLNVPDRDHHCEPKEQSFE